MTEFNVSADTDGAALVVNVAGEVDMSTAPQLAAVLEEHLRGGRYRTCEVDLGRVTFLDSTGIKTLLQGHRQAAGAGCDLRVRAASGWVARVIRVTGVADRLGLPPTADETMPDGAIPGASTSDGDGPGGRPDGDGRDGAPGAGRRE